MSDIKGKNFLLGLTGSIAAYKAAHLTRLLIKEGAAVKVIMTPLAKEFITPLTMATLSQNPILVDFFDPENGNWNSHVDLGLWADGFIIAPATANTMAKMANGIADNLLLTTYLSAKCPIFIAPAMDLEMFKHPANRDNMDKLEKLGHIFIEPEEGELASGLIGKGRLSEPETIVEQIKSFYQKKKSLINKTILITAGPTYENIDAVRFIGNYSSGKMGYALAEECACRGAKVILISGPVNIKPIHQNIELINTISANEMFDAAITNFEKVDAAIMAAAVADFTPEQIIDSKIKRKDQSLIIELKPTQDIAGVLGRTKKDKILVGFALEIENEIENAIGKLNRKNLDFIVLNSMNDNGAGFNVDTNKITIIDNNEQKLEFKIKDKNLVAIDIIDKLEEYL
ncbi:MAG: bifunctional phosphopantothenoylcysteine decarboxylase/phosphopantothenate--cysteine ligase CoaBC [Bacteroidales bacterium]|nr:bifunctional phosphopantothenoylcysteine decarboxylase/phosphopantothenate--cysteine ligase CoaBC [Bacteroidales bacterium]